MGMTATMSVSAAERRNPPPRQKACVGCTKSKRRCDFGSPACMRCSMRSMPCEYPSRTRARQPSTPRPDCGFTPDFNGTTILPSVPSVDSGYDSAEGVHPALANLDASTNAFLDMSYASMEESLSLSLPTVTALASPWVRDLDYRSEIITTRFKYAIETIKMAPRLMVMENRTPWSHAQLYQGSMPRSIRDVHAACALYLVKNEVNSPVIMRSIGAYCQDLLASPPPTTAIDALGHTHALLLYQIIRLFDGDIYSRANAERTIPALETSALSLLSHVRFEEPLLPPSDLPNGGVSPSPSFWRNWVFQESARRTMLFTFFFLQVYRMIVGNELLACDGKLGLVHSWTLSGHLWHANTPVEFSRVWREKNHYVVTNARFEAVLAEAKADDVDAFGRILLSTMMGNDEADTWLAERGGSLRKDDF